MGQLPPLVVTPGWWQDAEGVVAAVEQQYGVRVTVLRILSATYSSPPGGPVTYLAESEIADARLPLEPWGGELSTSPWRVPYAKPGGPARDLAWARSVLEDRGLRETGPPRQVRTWNLSSLWCLSVESGNVWLKHVPPFFAHEGAMLTRLQDAPVPRLLAHDGPRVLMEEIPGEDQYAAPEPTLLTMVSILVDLQLSWRHRVSDLLRLGLPDWRGPALSEEIADVVRRTAPELPAEDRRVLSSFVDTLEDRFVEAAESGVPDSLVHGDFAPGNARSDGRNLVLLDWGDCGVGHPLLDVSAFLDRIPVDAVPAVTRHWDRAWQAAEPGSDPGRARQVLASVSAARQAAIYRRFLDRIEPSEHPYHREDPATWLRRTACLVRGDW
jgi:hypothetical protein